MEATDGGGPYSAVDQELCRVINERDAALRERDEALKRCNESQRMCNEALNQRDEARAVARRHFWGRSMATVDRQVHWFSRYPWLKENGDQPC